jgi:hypothetical protein
MAIDFKQKLRLLREKAEQQASSLPTVNENENHLQAEKVNIPELPLTPSTAPAESTLDISGVNTAILLRLAQLEQDLLTQNPGINDSLRLIHRAMLNDPSQVTLLSLEQRGTYEANYDSNNYGGCQE